MCACYLSIVCLQRWVFPQFGVCVFIVDIVADADELLSTVSAGYKGDSHSNSVTLWNKSCVRSISLEERAGRQQPNSQIKVIPSKQAFSAANSQYQIK